MPGPSLHIRRDWPRPTEAELAPFRDAPTGFVVDSRGRRGALHHGIRPITRATRFCGTALTVWTRARDNLAPYAALDRARPGDVLVVATDGYDQASVVGDILAGMARHSGIVAVVTDGLVRDVPGLDQVGIPVFGAGISPNSPHKDGPGEVGFPITLGGMMVEPGDLILGDGDGVVVVPRGRLAATAAALVEVRETEAAMDAAILG
ncbi:MAG: RraA family protein, partial [Gemmatimonadaceae bacterium]|nr:RraA family protein [Acetobacteraceae bacterium]